MVQWLGEIVNGVNADSADSRQWLRGPREITQGNWSRPRFSICTLVTDLGQYDGMVKSFVGKGFTHQECEYLYVDNTDVNRFDAYAGYNMFLVDALGDFIILCHQDVELLEDGRESLESRLSALGELDPNWGVCGNSGGVSPGRVATRISDPHGENQSLGPFPTRVVALDENFMVVRRSANLAVSSDLSGFHHYGADLCMVADTLGYSCWVIDFHLRHRSPGSQGPTYRASQQQIIRKWANALRARWVVTSCSSYFIANSRLAYWPTGRLLAKVSDRLVQLRR